MRVLSRLAHAASLLALLSFAAFVASCELTGKLEGLEGGCPPLRGALQIKMTAPGGAYCIDATEATNAQYAQFLASGFALAGPDAPAGCEAVTDGTPSAHWPANPGYESFPVAEVSWCQASAFCRWAGKRMCGAIGGGPVAAVSSANASVSQWQNACTNGGTRTYPYGSTYDAAACANTDLSLVGSHPACEGGSPGVKDMSGNVWEWTDTCATADADSFCDAFGGAFDSTPAELTCASERNWKRTSAAANIGIRCCLDL